MGSTITCEGVTGPTNAPLTTVYPCADKFTNCPQYRDKCWNEEISSKCEKTCQLCPGMTPLDSYTCYDFWNNCGQLAPQVCTDSDPERRNNCKKTCGTCTANTPVPKPTSEPTTPGTTKQSTAPAEATCTCSNGVDENGYGKCEKSYKEKELCYVNDPSSCSDLKESSFGKWSFVACGNENTTPSPTPGPTPSPTPTCTCSNGVDDNGYGKCFKTYENKEVCYVTEPSSCSDVNESSFGKYSFEACGVNVKTTPKPAPRPTPSPNPNPNPYPNPNPPPNPNPWDGEEHSQVGKDINIFYSHVDIHA